MSDQFIYFFILYCRCRLDALQSLMSFFVATDVTNSAYTSTCSLSLELCEEISRRHYLWRNGRGLRSVLLEGGDFISVLACQEACQMFSGGRYVSVCVCMCVSVRE